LGISKLSHAVAARVLEAPEQFETHWRSIMDEARPLMQASALRLQAKGLIEGAVPAAGCVYFPRIIGVTDTVAVVRRLLENHQVLVAPGEYFGAPGYLRIGFAQPAEVLEQGLRQLEEGLSSFPR
jgi:aspartate/methionine/tyrosine aminotransferase